jgi:hypothetical protein
MVDLAIALNDLIAAAPLACRYLIALALNDRPTIESL